MHLIENFTCWSFIKTPLHFQSHCLEQSVKYLGFMIGFLTFGLSKGSVATDPTALKSTEARKYKGNLNETIAQQCL